MTFPLSESGLSRALHLLRERPIKGDPLTRPDPTPPALRELAKRIAAFA